jgi:hypothetical protein
MENWDHKRARQAENQHHTIKRARASHSPRFTVPATSIFPFLPPAASMAMTTSEVVLADKRLHPTLTDYIQRLHLLFNLKEHLQL